MRPASARLSLLTKALAMAVLAGFVFSTTAADAKPRKRSHVERSKSNSKSRNAAVARSTSGDTDGGRWYHGSAAIVIDANTGRVLYEENADALRHPASVTKVMTLYLLFEQLEAGRLKLSSDLPVSAKAAAQSPSKLGLRPGSSIEVEDAIKAIVTRSANDVAVVIAEAIGGSESNFADMMTRKARALGMTRTNFENASGLPNPNQLTTARDLSILGRAIQDRFPREYRYFATRTFYYRGAAIGNHNHLLGSVEGVDGIKTGYTSASGFNLLTSLKRDNRYLVAVVLGGRSAGSRDAHMRELLNDQLPRAYAGGRTAPPVSESGNALAFAAPLPTPAARDEIPPHAVAPLPKPEYAMLEPDPATTASIPAEAPARAGSAQPIRPVAVRTVSIQRTTTTAAPPSSAVASATAAARGFNNPAGVLGYLEPTSSSTAMPPLTHTAARGHTPAPKPAVDEEPAGKDTTRFAPPPRPDNLALRAAAVAGQETAQDRLAQDSLAQDPMGPPPAPAPRPEAARPIRTASLAPTVPSAARETASDGTPASARSGWSIQIGAFGGEREARAKLDLARSKAKSALSGADAYTEKTVKGSTTLYRARFAGFDKDSAQKACRLLQRNSFACISIRN